jgi:predicted amidophosphoribosyltransferase
MPSVAELTALYGNFMLAPRHGADVCQVCFNLTRGFDRCFACAHGGDHLAVVAPISYSVGHEQLHHVLAGYKRLQGATARRFTIELAAVLWRHLAAHERCIARAAGTERFELVTTVPSSDPERDEHHPLRRIVGELAAPTRERHARLLRRSGTAAGTHQFHADRYEATRVLSDESILLIDDTWTTGANAQSAACALRAAGAGPVAVLVIGRYLNREWHQNDSRLRALSRPFDWDTCALCA